MSSAISGDDAKRCTTCDVEKPLIDFPRRASSPDGHHWWCFDCKRARDREYGRRYRDRHPDQKRQSARKYVRKEEVRKLRSEVTLRQKYGLTPEAFDAKLAAQDRRCPFCPVDAEVTKWDVDHDHLCCPGAHTCGKCLRDLLCHKHNVGLGYWGDDPEALRSAADYIEKWRAVIKPKGTTPDAHTSPLPQAPVPRQRKPRTFLTAEQMANVRSEYGRPGVTQQKLAERYGVSQSVISNVINYTD